MNLSDARLVGVSAVTAAAVALVTVIVYEGHVKVTSQDKTIEVPAGTTVQVAPNKPPEPQPVVSGREKRLESKVKFLELENELLRKKLEPAWLTPTDVNNFNAVMKPIAPKLKKCQLGSTATEATLNVELKDGGLRLEINAQPAVKQPTFECVDALIGKLDFGSVKKGAYTYAVEFEKAVTVVTRTQPQPLTVKPPVTVVPTPPVVCEDKPVLDKIEAKADDMMSAGSFATGLQTYERILKCRPSVATKAYIAACRSRNFPKAKVMFKLVGKEALAQVCLKDGFDPRSP